jgi:benzil reductase ((S)-benzoin forming)
MNRFYITGTSSGIGLELANQLLQNPENYVVGICRRQAIEHPRYTHVKLDLCNLDAVSDFEFALTGDETELVLVNNAGWVGEVAPLGSGLQDHDAIIESYNINLIAPTILINQFVLQIKNLGCRKVILNISSGAGRHPVPSWATYCASKAGVDMISRVVNQESPEIETYAVAPGIVDTPMQKRIRETKPENFAEAARFKAYHKNGELTPTSVVAEKIIHFLKKPEIVSDTVFSLRDIIL